MYSEAFSILVGLYLASNLWDITQRFTLGYSAANLSKMRIKILKNPDAPQMKIDTTKW